jgi:hypothetical protein
MIGAKAQARSAAINSVQVRALASPLSLEFLLVAACCRRSLDDDRTAAIRAAARDVSDWEHFLRVVKRHRVAMQVRHALGETGIEVPPTIGKELDAIVERHVLRGLKLAAETVRLQNLLTDAGIPNLVLKGVALEQLAYGSISTKQTRDIDLLVPPECAEAALQIIEDDGYALALPAKNLMECSAVR